MLDARVVFPLLALGSGLAVAQERPDLLANGGFETEGGAIAEGWVLNTDVGATTASRMTDGAPEGTTYIRVSRQDSGQADLRQANQDIPADADAAYLLTAKVRTSNVAGGAHSIELQWFGPGTFIGRDIASAQVAGQFVQAAVGPVRPPKGAQRVVVLLRCYQPGDYDFDDVRLERVEGMDENILRNPGFESDADGDGIPDGWTGSPDGATWDAEMAASGGRSAKLSRTDVATVASWRQDGAPVLPSMRYELSAKTRCDVFGRELKMTLEWLAGGAAIGTSELSDQTFQAWQRKALAATSPPNADAANVVLELTSAGTLWFDDVCLTPHERTASVRLEIVRPNPRGLVRRGVDGEVLDIACPAESVFEGASVVVTLANADGPMGDRYRRTLPIGDAHTELDISALDIGRYLLHAEVRDTDGKMLAEDIAYVDILPADARGVFFRGDHIAEVNGKPWFPIGVFYVSPLDDEAAGLAEAGFNLLMPSSFTQGTPDDVKRALDRARDLGVYVIDNSAINASPQVSYDERLAASREVAAKVADHPAFVGLIVDELLWNGVPLPPVIDSYRAFRQALPTRVFWQNQAPRNTIADLAEYCRGADVTGMDIYPVEGADHSDLPNKTLSVVGDEVEKNRETVGDRKPVWAILQGFGWSAWEANPDLHKRAPTWHETRFMAYDAILSGAVGIIYWGASYEKRDTDIWTSLRRIASELRDLTPALVSPGRVDVPAGSDGDAVLATGRRVDGKLFVLAVNESGTPATATLSLPAGVAAVTRFAEEGDAPTVIGGQLADSFEAYGVHVYQER